MSYQQDALFGQDCVDATLPPQMMNAQADGFGDIMLYGLAGAAQNALSFQLGIGVNAPAPGTAAAVPAPDARQVRRDRLTRLLLVGGIIYLMLGNK